VLFEAGADHLGRSEAYWSNFPTVTRNVSDSEKICQNQTEGKEIGESQCGAVVAAAVVGHRAACCPDLSTFTEGVAGQQGSRHDEAALRAGNSSLVAEGRHRDAATCDNIRSCSLVGEVTPSSTPSVAYWSNLSTVIESVADNRQEWQKEAELKEAEVRQWEAAVAAIVSGQCNNEIGVADHSADCYSDPPTSTWELPTV